MKIHLGAAVLAVAVAVGVTACDTASRPAGAPSDTAPSISLKQAAADYRAMSKPVDAAADHLAALVTSNHTTTGAVAAACNALAAAETKFAAAMRAERWPTHRGLAVTIDAAIYQRTVAHRCYLDNPDQSAMDKDLDDLWPESLYSAYNGWREALGLPPTKWKIWHRP